MPVAEVARPHGVQGEIRLKVYNADSDLLLRRPPVVLELPDGSRRETKLLAARPSNQAILVRLEGVADRDQAERLRGGKLLVARDLFPVLEEDEFYACDVEGARALLPGDALVGIVVELRSYPTCDVLVVRCTDGGTLEVPLTGGFVDRVDVGAGVVHLATIEGLER